MTSRTQLATVTWVCVCSVACGADEAAGTSVQAASVATPPAAESSDPPAAEPAARSVDPADVSREFGELRRLLTEMRGAFGASRKFCAPDPGSELAARLALFPHRFGSEPQAAPEWPAFQSMARSLLVSVGSSGSAGSGIPSFVSPHMDRYVLLDILGRFDEAQQILDSVQTLGADGCIWCTAENSVVVSQRRSELAERRGNLAGALAFLHDAALDVAVLSGVAGEDLLCARYGLLLLDNGHDEEGTALLQSLTTRAPNSLGAEVALAELRQRGAVHAMDQACMLAVQHGPSACLGFSLVAVYRLDDPGSMRWISMRLPARNETECTRTAAFDEEAAREAEGLLRAWITEVGPLSAEALMLMQARPGGAAPHVRPCLDRLADAGRPSGPFQLQAFDKALRWLHGGGPVHAAIPGAPPEHVGAAFASAWREWLDDR
jgi:hypothetical protein